MILLIHLERLPDISNDRDFARYSYKAYGRFAILRSGVFWIATLHSSHPLDTATGWYWAISKDDSLLVSARGAGIDGERLFEKNKPVLALLIEELVKMRIIAKPTSIKIV